MLELMSGYQKKWIKKKPADADDEKGKDEGPGGPCYAKPDMLRFFELLQTKGITDSFKLGYKTTVREDAKEDDGQSPEERRKALQEVLKSQRQAKAKAKDRSDTKPANPKAKAVPKAQVLAQNMPRLPQFPVWPIMVPPMNYMCQLWGSKATMKLSNVPTSLKQEELAASLVFNFRGALDFLLLPEAPEGSAEGVNNCGHAFVNFRVPQGAEDFKKKYENARWKTCFPGHEGDAGEKSCKVLKVKIQNLDKQLHELRLQATSGKQVRFPVLLDLYGNARPLPHENALQAQQAVAAAQAAQAQIQAAGIFGPVAAEASSALRQQIEYYFSFENMCRDVYLRNQMDEEGWVPLSLIGSFKRVQALGVRTDDIASHLLGSEVVEVDGEKHRIRQKDAKQRLIWDLHGAVDGKKAAAAKEVAAEKAEAAKEEEKKD